MSREDFQGKKVLITGGVGFIGSHLARQLVRQEAQVTLVDSLNPLYGGNLHNIHDISDRVRVNISDIRDPHSMRHLVQDQDVLFNLAGQTSHMDSMQDPHTDLDINAKAQLYVLEACRRYNPGITVVFASTRQVYGKPHYLPADEQHPLSPVDINGVNKLAGEWYHLLYHEIYGIRTCVCRLTNTIGPGMRIKDARQTFVGIWIRRLLEGRPFEVWGGEALRDFTYVDDAVDALLRASTMKQSAGKVYNLGGDRVISLTELAAMLVSVHGRGEYAIIEYPDDRKKIDIGDYYADYSLISAELGWQPRVPLEEALRQTVAYYQANLAYYIDKNSERAKEVKNGEE